MKNQRKITVLEEFAQQDVELHLVREAAKSRNSHKVEVYHFRPVIKGYPQQQFI
jgi:hypothetical protein